MDTLRVGGSSFVFGEHTNKVFTILEFDENTQKLELILPIQAFILYQLFNLHFISYPNMSIV